MRVVNKYKLWLKLFSKNFPLRLLQFKKSKWKKIKKLKNFKRTPFFKIEHTPVSVRNWERLKNYYKIKLKLKLFYKLRYDCTVFTKNFLKNKKIKLLFLNNFMRMNYRVDILLSQLKLFSSPYETRDYIKQGVITLNNKILKSDQHFLMKGDILHIKNYKSSNLKLINYKKEILFSFLEVDYYTQTLVIIKNVEDLSLEDITCNLHEKFSSFLLNHL